MTSTPNAIQSVDVLDEIIDNAAELPLENQKLLVLLAKSMTYQNKKDTNEDKIQSK